MGINKAGTVVGGIWGTVLPPNLGRNGLIQIQTPTEADVAAATVSLSEAWIASLSPRQKAL